MFEPEDGAAGRGAPDFKFRLRVSPSSRLHFPSCGFPGQTPKVEGEPNG